MCSPEHLAVTRCYRRSACGCSWRRHTASDKRCAANSGIHSGGSLLQQHIAPWQAWHAERSERHAVPLDVPPALAEEFLVSTIVLRSHLDKTYPGAMVASLSIPWGDSGNERGGYHLVWPRDLVETAGALVALGAEQEARDTLRYLIATQIGTATGIRTSGSAGGPIGKGFSSTKPPFSCCSPRPWTNARP